jgi:hypothetical protein
VLVTLIDDARSLATAGSPASEPSQPQLELVAGGIGADTSLDLAPETAESAVVQAPDPDAEPEPELALGDLEAAVGLVSAGLATRVVLTGFPSWPGLLWHAYRLAEAADVLILPTVVRPGGRVDIVITRESSANG